MIFDYSLAAFVAAGLLTASKPRAVRLLSVYLAVKPVGKPDAGNRLVRFLMSGDGKRGVAEWPKLPRPSSTPPERKSFARGQLRVVPAFRSVWGAFRSLFLLVASRASSLTLLFAPHAPFASSSSNFRSSLEHDWGRPIAVFRHVGLFQISTGINGQK